MDDDSQLDDSGRSNQLDGSNQLDKSDQLDGSNQLDRSNQLDESDEVDEVSIRIAAAPMRCYELVADITQMGRLSPECTGGRWIGRNGDPVVGARFIGYNRRGWVRWATVNKVVAAEPGVEFAFETGGSGTRWRYRFESDGDDTVVTESREPTRDRPLVARVVSNQLLGGVEQHDQEMRDGMRTTLERLKVLAEST